MLIGIDFDNTIVCYDQAILKLSHEIPGLPPELPRTKLALRDFFRQQDREPEWTAFQGALYGPGMRYAEPFEGAIATMRWIQEVGHKLVVVSHRSLRPYAGPLYDLHGAAKEWVEQHLAGIGLFGHESVWFRETRTQKIQTIARLGCNIFLDDLPEVLRDPAFPSSTLGILFDPERTESSATQFISVQAWSQLPEILERLV